MACITIAHNFEGDVLDPALKGGADVTVQDKLIKLMKY